MIVGVLVIWALLDVVPRFFSIEWLHVLPEHVATRRPGKFAPFIPNLKIHYDPWVGESATTGNLTPDEKRPPIDFSTDNLGFRLTPNVPPDGRVDMLLYDGASFAYGGGLSDDETFPAVLTRQSGLKTYNGGHFFWDYAGLEALDWMQAEMGHQRPGVILVEWEQAERGVTNLTGLKWKTDRPGQKLLGAERYAAWRSNVQYAYRYLFAITNISPLQVLCVRGFKSLCNDAILPNRYAAAVVERRLPNGKRMIFLREEYDRAINPPNDAYLQRKVEYFDLFARELAKRNQRMYVILLPNRYTLYGPAVDGFRPAQPRYLDRLEAALKSKNIAVMNALTLLESRAATELTSDEDMSFHREDHHWTALGVRRVSSAFAEFLREKGR